MGGNMLEKFKRFMIALCVMTLTFTTCAFAASEPATSQTGTQDLTEYVKYYTQSYAQSYGSVSKAELEYMIDNSVGAAKKLAEGIYTYAQNDALGALLSIGDVGVTRNGDVYKAEVTLTYEKGNMTMNLDMQYLLDDLRVTDANISFKSQDSKSFGDVMKQAGINTLIGISIVFVMLALMSILIAQFKHINKLTQRAGKNKDTAAAEHVGIDNAVSQIVENESSEVDDLELIAVITAAIAASEDAPSDGFTVRSIRRVRF